MVQSVSVCVYACACLYACACASACSLYVCVCVCVCICVYMCMCMRLSAHDPDLAPSKAWIDNSTLEKLNDLQDEHFMNTGAWFVIPSVRDFYSVCLFVSVLFASLLLIKDYLGGCCIGSSWSGCWWRYRRWLGLSIPDRWSPLWIWFSVGGISGSGL